jgi:cytochrome c peroxidase
MRQLSSIFRAFLPAAVLLTVLSGCTLDGRDAPVIPLENVIQPPHFPARHYQFGENQYSKEGFELGRALFFDPILSVDSTVSCASCHHQEYAFSDGGKAVSDGIMGQQTSRNSPVVFNMGWSPHFMFDGGITHLEVMPFAPITNEFEMGEDLARAIEKLNAHPEYPYRFRKLFGRSPIDDQQLFYAFALYMANTVSADAPYDRYVLGEGKLNVQELAGLQIFREKCNSCHTEPLFTDFSFANNGLDSVAIDIGRFRVTQDSADLGLFKVPTLRNIALSAPYMHDGRISTLEQVLDHYDAGMQESATLSPEFRRDGRPGIALSPDEKTKLIAFLHTLTDPELLSDPELVE